MIHTNTILKCIVTADCPDRVNIYSMNTACFRLYNNNQNKQTTKVDITVHAPGILKLQNEPTYIKLQPTKLHFF